MFCWLFRFKISGAVDAENRLSPATQRHVYRCADCRAFYQTSLSLGEGLRREAAVFDEDLPSQFVQRVFDAVPVGADQTFKLPGRRLRPVLAVACIGIVASLAAVFLALSQNEPTPVDPTQISGIYRLIDDGHPTAWAGFVEKPLSDEIDNLAEGTESAVRFLIACVTVRPTNIDYELPN
jgi:hypothetical protein